MTEKLLWPEGIQTFEKIIEKNSIYVDKTAYLANMIEGSPKTWFLVRPRRFGKSLTVSTLKSIFSGNKELFKGLAIEKKLGDKKF
ncbi:MAG: AAA family ATPase, partial [Deltaproteobacteria bacterium]|nr:AAA family ATPase [Deltaproteobacteria bacterium]